MICKYMFMALRQVEESLHDHEKELLEFSEFVAWASKVPGGIEQVWAECSRGDWLLSTAQCAGLDCTPVVLACVERSRQSLVKALNAAFMPDDAKLLHEPVTCAESASRAAMLADNARRSARRVHVHDQVWSGPWAAAEHLQSALHGERGMSAQYAIWAEVEAAWEEAVGVVSISARLKELAERTFVDEDIAELIDATADAAFRSQDATLDARESADAAICKQQSMEIAGIVRELVKLEDVKSALMAKHSAGAP